MKHEHTGQKSVPQKVVKKPQLPLSAELFRLISENAEDLIAIVDIHGRRLYNSASYKKALGKETETLVGTDAFHEIHPDDRDRIRTIFQHTVTTGIGSRAEFRFVLEDGSMRYIESQGNAIRDSRGSITGVVTVSRDATERRHSESKLRLLAHALSSTKDCFCFTDLNDHILFVNHAFTEKYGYTEDELAGKHISLIRSPRNPKEVLEQIVPATHAGGWNGELINRKRDGSEFSVELWTSVVHGETGFPVGFVGVARDISDRKAVEETLAHESMLWHTLMDNIPDTIYFKDAVGRFTRINKAQAAVLGVAKVEDAIGKTDFDFFTKEHAEVACQDERKILQTGFSLIGKIEKTQTLNGTLRWFSTTKLPLRDADGMIAGIVGSSREISELVHAESQLKESESKYRLLFESNPEAMYVVDLESSRFLAVNETTITRYGYSREEFMSMTVEDIRPPSELPKFRELLSHPVELRAGFSDMRHQKKDGTIVDVEIIAHPITFAGRRASLAIVKDVTESRRAVILQEAIYRISQAADKPITVDELFHEVHRIIQIVMPADNFYIALYDDIEDLLSFPYFVDEVDIAPGPRGLGNGLTEYVLRTGKSLLCDATMDEELQRRGEVKLVGASCPIWLGVPLIVENKTIGVMTVQHYADPKAYGIREQQMLEFVSSQVAKAIHNKRSEEALEASEQKYRTLFEESGDAILLTTPGGKLVDANPAAIELFGCRSRDEMLQKGIAPDLYGSPQQQELFTKTLAAQGFAADFEFEVRRSNDERRVVLESASTVLDEQGNIIGYRRFLRDITERKKLEDQLRQAQKMESIGTLAGGIAHDFNNLLGIILGYASLLQDGKLDREHMPQCVDAIMKAGERGAGLVSQLLTFARKSETWFEPIDVNDTVNELVKMLNQTFPKTITISVQLAERLPTTVVDSGQLHQALLNLCVNSRDAILDGHDDSSGTGNLTIGTGVLSQAAVRLKFSEASAKEYIVVSVTDSGAGMNAETRSRIFEPFFTTKELGKGTGLGLSVVYGVINNHHGFVSVDSQLGRGTTFNLYFPVQAQALQRSAAAPTEGGQLPRGTETILVVEDEEMLLDLVVSLLEENGYQVMAAKDGQEGVEIYSQHHEKIACILSDMGLPRLGGWEMFLKMKQVNPTIKAILASGYCEPIMLAQMAKEGVKDFIPKPYIADTILKRIRETIDGVLVS